MAKCGNCNIEFKNRRHQVVHSLEVHESAFVDGSEELQAIQTELAKTNPRYAELIKKAQED